VSAALRAAAWLLLLLAACPARSALAKEEPGQDHPLISRYAGAEIDSYDRREFDEFFLANGKVTKFPKKRGQAEPALRLEGAVTEIVYALPYETSTFMAFRNYEQALAGAGFETLFACAGVECGKREFNHAVMPVHPRMNEKFADQRYIAARLARARGDVYVGVYIVRAPRGSAEPADRVFARVAVVELAPMKGGAVQVNPDAEAMARSITDTGRVALYGIYFSTDSAKLEAQSQDALDKIAELLRRQAQLNLVIVGHTDTQGALDYNMKLSGERAEAVRRALVERYGIQPARLSAWGAGFLAPVASNRDEPGRALNRRVELVER